MDDLCSPMDVASHSRPRAETGGAFEVERPALRDNLFVQGRYFVKARRQLHQTSFQLSQFGGGPVTSRF
jgi:hypothetical protein